MIFKKDKLYIVLILIVAILIRIIVIPIKGPDYNLFLSNWYNEIIQNGKLNSLGLQIGNYTPPYILFLTFGTYLISNSLLYIKVLSVIFDIICSIYVALIVYHFCNNKYKACLGFAISFIIPGIIINSSVLGQCDSIYTSFVLMFIYYILKGKIKLACFFFGIALSFKLQAIFVAPVLLYLIFVKKMKIVNFLYVIVGVFFFMIPSMIYGKNIIDIINIYTQQTKEYGMIVKSAPNIYSLVSLNYVKVNLIIKYFLSLTTVIFSIFIVLYPTKKNNNYSDKIFFINILILSLIVPYLLPGMMDRYFYMANIFLLINIFIMDKKNKLIIIFMLANIAYFVPVLTINFLSDERTFYYCEKIGVTTISSVINTYIIIYMCYLYKNINNTYKMFGNE